MNLTAVWLVGMAWACGEVQVAGGLLVDLAAQDFKLGAEKWPQRGSTGIPGDFVAKGSPKREMVAGADAVVFDGDGDYFIGPITTAALHAPGAKHSVEIWVYQGNVRAQESVVSWGKRWGPDGTFAGFRYGTDPDFGAIARWVTAESGFAVVPVPGVWHLLSFTYDGKEQAVYVDGKLDNKRAVGLLDAHDMLPIYLGGELRGDLQVEGTFIQYSGALAKVRIHSGALTAAEVKQNYEAERAEFPGLVAKPLQQMPLHRFSFDLPAGPAPDGTTVADSIGGLTAVIRGDGAQFTGSAVELPGGSSATQAYIDLPNGLLSARENVTIEFWETQLGTEDWSRILSIGTNLGGEISGPGGDFSGSETLTLFGNVGAMQVNRFARSFGDPPNGGPDRNPADYPDTDFGVEFQQTITYDKRLEEWHWYRNGVLMEVIPDRLGSRTLPDVNVWLGRSEFSADKNFWGRFREVRVYNRALSDGEIYGNFLAGPGKLNGGNADARTWTPVEPGLHAFSNVGNADQWGTGAGGPFPSGPGSTATFANALLGDQEITLDAPVTLGALNLGSSDLNGCFTLRGTGAKGLTMDSGGPTAASIVQLPRGPGNFLYAPIELKSDTEIINQSANPLLLGGEIRGKGAFIKGGAGPVILSAENKDHRGPVKVLSGALILGEGPLPGNLSGSDFTVLQPGKLIFNLSVATDAVAAVDGNGAIVQQGRGELRLSEKAHWTGGMAVLVGDGAGVFRSRGKIEGVKDFVTDGEAIFSGGSVTWLDGNLSLGRKNGGQVTVEDTAVVRLEGTGHLNIGDLATGQSTLTVTGGQISCNELFVGKNAGTSGVILQTGGEIHKYKHANFPDTRLGGFSADGADAYGAWLMSGGTFQDEWNLQIGADGTGAMVVTGGQVRVAGFLSLGRFSKSRQELSHGMLDVRSGGVAVTSPETYLLVGEEGVGVLNIRGGVVTCANKMMIGAGSIERPGQGTVNLLQGGMLETGGIGQYNQTDAVGWLNLDGGLLKALKSTDTFFDGIDAAFVREGGAGIDTNGFDVKLSQPLLAAAGNGVMSIPVENGGAGYVGPPVLAISGGATAVADVVDGVVRSITVTCRGGNFEKPPTVAVFGGGSGSGLVAGTPVLAANVSGGLVKTGAGVLSLTGKNTYRGLTSVEQGRLRIVGDLAGAVRVAAGATFAGCGDIAGSLDALVDSTVAASSDKPLTISGDATIAGKLSVTSGARLDVAGQLTLTDATLAVQPSGTEAGGSARIIASYGALTGKFRSTTPLPAGFVIDYHFDGQNQIALVAPLAKTDGK